MKMPMSPPDYIEIINTAINNNDDEILQSIFLHQGMYDQKMRYVHWEKLRFLNPPSQFNSEQWWAALKKNRVSNYETLPLFDKENKKFNFVLTNDIKRQLHWLDMNAAGSIESSNINSLKSKDIKAEYYINNLYEESITSSQLEGANTTRIIAKKMLKNKRKPKTNDEIMIFNNYNAMKFLQEIKKEDMSLEMIKEIHRIVSIDTIDNEKCGEFRLESDQVHVVDNHDNIVFTPPNAKEINSRLEDFCKFINSESNDPFIHPVIKAISAHFMISYIHPFIDGNGRTARAIFYWVMQKYGYWLSEYISISRILRKAAAKYSLSFLYTETDQNDLTYFIEYQIEVIRRSIEDLFEYISEKTRKVTKIEEIVNKNSSVAKLINYRQLSLLRHAIEHPGYSYSIDSYKEEFDLAYDTARKDLSYLSDDLNFLFRMKDGQKFIFISPDDLERRIRERS